VHQIAILSCLKSGVRTEITRSLEIGRRLFDCGFRADFATLAEMEEHLGRVPVGLLPR